MKCPFNCQKSKCFLILSLIFLASGLFFKVCGPANAASMPIAEENINNSYNQAESVRTQQREIIDCLKRLEVEIGKDQS